MACLGGTPAEPRIWFRYKHERFERHDGRICRRMNPRTSKRFCQGCPAFRGISWDGTVVNGLAPDESPYGLSASEHEQYQQALMDALIDDDFLPLSLFVSRMQREIGDDGVPRRALGQRVLMMVGDPAALAHHAKQLREYRANHPGLDKRKRKRDRTAYMRDYRARRKASA